MGLFYLLSILTFMRMKLPSIFSNFIKRSSSGALNPSNWLLNTYGGTQTRAGERVNGTTALQSSTVFACVSLISETLATLPWNVKKEYEVLEHTAIQRIISKRPNVTMQAIDFRRAIINSFLLYGNGYALPVRRGNQLSSLEFIESDSVSINKLPNGEIRYTVAQEGLPNLTLRPEQIIHIKAFTLDGYTGVSPIDYAKETIGTDLAATNHLANYYGSGATPKGYIKLLGTIRDPERLKSIGSDFDQNYGSQNSGKTAVLPEGGEYVPVSSSMRDAQFIDSQKWTTEEICRIFKVPPHKVGRIEGISQNMSIESQNANFVSDCIRPWAELLEMEFTDKLIGSKDQFIEIDFKKLLRGDTNTQVTKDVSYWNIGVLNKNEIRESMGMPPVEGGDEYHEPLNMSNQNDINNGKQEENPN